jgi:hypothetical protein
LERATSDGRPPFSQACRGAVGIGDLLGDVIGIDTFGECFTVLNVVTRVENMVSQNGFAA